MSLFSEDDARRIFARAAQRQGAGDADPDGLSLAELQAIGASSGIDPAHVAAAAAELRAGAATPPRGGFAGIPAHVEARRVVPGALSEAAWARTVENLRATFGQTGVVSVLGDTREWTAHPSSGRDGVRVQALPRPDGQTELVAQNVLATNVRSLKVMTALFGGLTAVLTVAGLLAAKPGSWMFGPMVGLCLAVALGIPAWVLYRQARHAERAFGPLLDRAELAAHTAPDDRHAEPDHAPHASAGQVDLPDAAPDPPSARRRTRRRAR